MKCVINGIVLLDIHTNSTYRDADTGLQLVNNILSQNKDFTNYHQNYLGDPQESEIGGAPSLQDDIYTHVKPKQMATPILATNKENMFGGESIQIIV